MVGEVGDDAHILYMLLIGYLSDLDILVTYGIKIMKSAGVIMMILAAVISFVCFL